ncbi:ABC transporter substrate-binding protein [Jiangella ureilytica]|uniref:ABC transporter substrate-binding protein n=1 Tax=Jiangella ureilytica TaxID=2530374 RepID=A0A4R4RTA5_9ACTN|nr:ABC transporter substrate-binding protein [Jiangella ureilytica]TDC53277.1 ABC transporter substrate-binding protein [Jiangella ureilytica]
MRTSHTLLMLLAAALAGSAGCGASSGPTGDTRGAGETPDYATDGTFTYAVNADPGGFDPYHSQLIFGLAYLAYDSLVNLRPDGEFVSGLAEEWTADADGATFTLRDDVTCSDGAPLTAGDVAAAISYVADPANQSPHYGTMVPTVPLTATGDDAARTVTVTFQEPFGFPLHTIGNLPIVCAGRLADPDSLKTGSNGTGPFTLTEVVPGQTYTFTRRDDYAWGPDGASTSAPGTPARVVLRIGLNETTMANLLLSGEVNFALISGPDGQRLDAQGLTRLDTPGSGAWLWFNQRDGRATDDLRVRRALVHTLDLEEVIKVNGSGRGTTSTGLVTIEPQVCPGDTVSGQLPEYDVAAAEELLDDAGWVAGADGVREKDGRTLTLNLHYFGPGSVYNEPTAELIAAQWQAIGVQVELTGDDGTGLNRVMFETGDFDVYMQGFGYSLPSQAISYNTGPVPPDGTNLAGIHNEEYEELVVQAQALTPPEACTYWDRAEQALWRNLDIAPIANRPNTWFLQHADAEIAGFNFPIPTSIRVFS